MAKRWHVLQIERRRHEDVRMFLDQIEFEPLIPMMPSRRIVRGKVIEGDIPRFGCYIFARFDAEYDPWGHLTHSKAKRVGIMRVLCNAEMRPSPVPDKAINAIIAYEPSAAVRVEPYRFTTGEPCLVTKAGRQSQAVFVEYLGSRQFIRTWIFGSDRLTEVSAAELEPLNVDNCFHLDTMQEP